jgi:hypothetical protein
MIVLVKSVDFNASILLLRFRVTIFPEELTPHVQILLE